MNHLLIIGQTTAALRRIHGTIVGLDGIARVTTKGGGTARKIVNGVDSGAWTGTLTHTGNGEYYVELTQAEIDANAEGSTLSWGYKAADTLDAVVDIAEIVLAYPTLNFGPDTLPDGFYMIYGTICGLDGITRDTSKSGGAARKIVNGVDSGAWTDTLGHIGNGLYQVELTPAEYAALATGSVYSWGYKAADTSEAIVDRMQKYPTTSFGTAGQTIRNRILTALAARLATITTANGYRTNVGSDVHEWQVQPLDPSESVLRVEYRDLAESTEYQGVGTHLHTLPVTLRVVCQNNTAGSALSTVRDAMADIYQAIYADVTFGGLAQDTNQEGAAKEDYDEKADRAAGATVVYRIEYTTVPGTP